MSNREANESVGIGIVGEDGHPLVSVVIPAYNSSAYIAAALESVFQQTFSSHEVVVVNDGSPDTPALEAALQPYLSRLRYFRQENRGPSAARNVGIREARGRYVAMLDSDDSWLPHHLERQVDYFTRDAKLGLVYSNNMQISDDEVVGAAFETVPQTGPVTLESLLAEHCTVNTSSVVVSRDALLKVGLFDESLNRCEDFDLWLRLAAQGVRMTYDPDVQVVHRVRHGLSSDSGGMKRARAEVYRKATLTLSLSAAQQEIAAAKLKELEVEIEVEVAKEHLRAGRFGEAQLSVRRANSLAPAARLRIAELGIRFSPLLLRWSYDSYLRLLRWSRRRARAAARKGTGQPSNFDGLMRPRPVPEVEAGPATSGVTQKHHSHNGFCD
jgi:glycosyltransferase involved in cell wall biosynthesis